MGYPVRLGWQVMGSIQQPHRWLNGTRWNRPSTRTLVPLSTGAMRPALAGPALAGLPKQIQDPPPRNLFPGIVQSQDRPNGL